MPLTDDLKSLIEGEVHDDAETLAKFSKDASVFEVKPELVVAPKSTRDIEKLVKYVTDHPDDKLSLTPRAAGTCMAGGSLNTSIILDMLPHFNKITELTPDYTISQPGVYYRDLDTATQKINRFFPPYTSSRDQNTIGGMIGNNSAGEKTLSYGSTANYIQELKMVLSDGEEHTFKPLTQTELKHKMATKGLEGQIYTQIHRLIDQNRELIAKSKPPTSKNSTGYYIWNVEHDDLFDLTKLLTGSQGTLGIITEAKLKLVEPKPYSNLLVIYLNNTKKLGELINAILDQNPESLECYDDETLKIAARFLPEIYAATGGNIFKFYYSALSEIWMAARHKFPKLVIMAEFTGNSAEEAKLKLVQARNTLNQFNLPMRNSYDHIETCKFWTIRRQSFGLLRRHATASMHTAPFIDDIIVNPEFLPEFLPQLNEVIYPYRKHLIYTLAGHIGNGNFHIIPLMNFADPKTFEIIPELSDKVFKLVKQYHGSMAAEHNDGIIRGVFLKEFYGDKMYKIFQEIKQIFDPQNIFNPNKKANVTWDFYHQALIKPSLNTSPSS